MCYVLILQIHTVLVSISVVMFVLWGHMTVLCSVALAPLVNVYVLRLRIVTEVEREDGVL